MANILITGLQNIIGGNINNMVCFYDSLNEELRKTGNNILWLNTLQELFFDEKDKKTFSKWIQSWIDEVKNFKPDIIFTFNNRIFEEIIQVTNCPIVLFEADLAEFFVKTDLIKKYNERYFIATYSNQYIEKYKQLGFRENQIIVIHRATAVQNEKKEKVNNISFIGSLFAQTDFKLKYALMQNSENLYKMYLEFWNSENYNYEELVEKYFPNNKLSVFDCYKIFDGRVYILQSILDLGLKLYGVDYDTVLHPQLIALSSAFDKTPKYSLIHNQEVYNSSVVNISISHPQCRGYDFPWRIYDIMASGGVLVSSYSEKLHSLTKDFVDIPMYKSPYAARDLCKKMLKEENFRNDIIAASNEFIEKFGRWSDNIEKIGHFTGVELVKNAKGNISFINYELKMKKRVHSDCKLKFKSVINGSMYAAAHLPVLGDILNRKKIYKSMLKYNKELENYILEYG